MPLFSKKNQDWVKRKHYNVAIEGKKVICPFCDNDTFDIRSVQLNHGLSAAMDTQVFDKTCTALICGKCGHIEHFYNDAEKLGGPVN